MIIMYSLFTPISIILCVLMKAEVGLINVNTMFKKYFDKICCLLHKL